jgi:hypothetical protein
MIHSTRHRLPLFFVLACLTWCGASGLRAADADVAALTKADDARVAAMIAADQGRLEEILSPNLRYAHSNGLVDNRAEFIGNLVSGKSNYLSYEHEERVFEVSAPGLALMHGRARVKAIGAQGEVDLRLSYLAAWKLEDGKWRFLAWQSCRL